MTFLLLYLVPLFTLLLVAILSNRCKEASRKDALFIIIFSFIPILNMALLIVMSVIFCIMILYELVYKGIIEEYWESFIKWILPHE